MPIYPLTSQLYIHTHHFFFFFSSRRRHTRYIGDWSSDVVLFRSLHELLRPELAGHRPEDAGADGLAVLADHHRAVGVELDVAAVGPLQLALGAHDHGARDLALLHLAVDHRLLDGDDDHVADRSVPALGAAQHLDAGHLLGAGVIGHVQHRLHLDHDSDLCLPLHLGFRLDQDLGHAPALLPRHRARLDDPHLVTRLRRLVLVVALVLLLLGHVLAVLAVLGPALDLHDDRLHHLVGEDGADAALGASALRLPALRVLGHRCSFPSAGCSACFGGGACFCAALRCALLTPVFCVRRVRIRARSRLFFVTSAVDSSVPARRRILRLKRFSRSSPALRVSSSTLSSFSSEAFILRSQLSGPADHPGVERRLVRGEAHRFLRDLGRHAFHLVDHAAHLHHGDPLLDIPLAVAHARLGRLLGDRLVGEHPDPDLAAALDEAGHGDAARLDLARGEAARLEHLEAVVAERELASAVGLALVAALLLLAELRSCWLHHDGVSLGQGVTAPASASSRRWSRGWERAWGASWPCPRRSPGAPRHGRSTPCSRSSRRWSSPPRIRSRCPRAACAAAPALRGTTRSAPFPRRPAGPSRPRGSPWRQTSARSGWPSSSPAGRRCGARAGW